MHIFSREHSVNNFSRNGMTNNSVSVNMLVRGNGNDNDDDEQTKIFSEGVKLHCLNTTLNTSDPTIKLETIAQHNSCHTLYPK